MNSDSPQDPRSALESNLTALLLGELPHQEAAALHQKLARDPELAARYERLKHTINLVRETVSSPAHETADQPAPLKLSEERRQQLLQHFKTVVPREFAQPRRPWVPSLLQLGVAAALVLLLASLLLPAVSRSKSKAMRPLSLSFLSRSAESAAQAPSSPPSARDENGLAERLPQADRESVAGKPATPLAQPVPTPIASAGTAIVLPKDGEPADAASQSAFRRGYAFQSETAPASKVGQTHDDVSGGDYLRRGVTTAAPEVKLSTDPSSARGRQAELADSSSFYTKLDAAGALELAKSLNKDGRMPALGEPSTLSQSAAENRKGSERLQERATAAASPGQAAPKALEPTGTYYGGGAYGGYSTIVTQTLPNPNLVVEGYVTISNVGDVPIISEVVSSPGKDAGISPGKASLSRAPEIALNESASRQNELLTSGLRASAAPEHEKQDVFSLSLQPGAPPAQAGQSAPGAAGDVFGVQWSAETTEARLAATARDKDKTLGFDWYLGNTLAANGLITGGNLQTFDNRQTGKPVALQNTLQGVAPQPDSLLAIDGTSDVSQHLNFDTRPMPGLSNSDTDQVALLDDAPAAGRSLYRMRGDGLADGGKLNVKGEEKAKSASSIALPVAPGETTLALNNTDTNQKSQQYSAAKAIKALEERFGAQEQKVREAQAKVDRLRKELNISDAVASAGTTSPLITAETLRDWERTRIENKTSLVLQETLLNRLKELKKDRGEEELAQVITTAAPDSLLSSLLEQSERAEQKAATLQKQYGPENTEVLKSKANAEELHAKIKSRVDGIMNGYDAKVTALKNSLENLENELGTATTNDATTAPQSRAYFQAKRELEDLQRLRKTVPVSDKNAATEAPQKVQSDTAAPKPAAPPAIPQPEVQTRDNAFSTFSLNVSDVSFKLAAASLEKGVMPEPATVRSEEFINAFDYRDPEPPPGVPVAFAWERAQYPFAQNRDLLHFSIKTAAQGRQPGRPMNIVLLLDNSGSMERADRVQIIREALRVLAAQLQPQDKFSVVTFARTTRLWVDGVPGNQAAQVVEEVSGITPQGGTNLEDAMNLAYQTAQRHYLASGINRVVLLTDGAANLGDVEPQTLKQKVEANRKQGIALDCFGIGWEGYNDDLLEVLSRNGDGRYGFINTPEEAATGFAAQLAGALQVAASDVKVQVEFNPARVTAYRQIGYAKHQLTKEQFRDNTVAAAQIGAAESGNALYVVEVNPAGNGPLATVRVRYRVPGTSDVHEHEWPVPYTGNAVPLDQSTPAMRLAATASAFSEWLVSSPYATEITPDRLLGYLNGVPEVYGADPRPKKLEWMLRQAKSISGK